MSLTEIVVVLIYSCWSSIGSEADTEVICGDEERAEPEGQASNLQVNLRPNSHLWS